MGFNSGFKGLTFLCLPDTVIAIYSMCLLFICGPSDVMDFFGLNLMHVRVAVNADAPSNPLLSTHTLQWNDWTPLNRLQLTYCGKQSADVLRHYVE